MKKTCNRCKADLNYSEKFCGLGFKRKCREICGMFVYNIPAQECPKPLTYSDYFYLLDKRQGTVRKIISLS